MFFAICVCSVASFWPRKFKFLDFRMLLDDNFRRFKFAALPNFRVSKLNFCVEGETWRFLCWRRCHIYISSLDINSRCRWIEFFYAANFRMSKPNSCISGEILLSQMRAMWPKLRFSNLGLKCCQISVFWNWIFDWKSNLMVNVATNVHVSCEIFACAVANYLYFKNSFLFGVKFEHFEHYCICNVANFSYFLNFRKAVNFLQFKIEFSFGTKFSKFFSSVECHFF